MPDTQPNPQQPNAQQSTSGVRQAAPLPEDEDVEFAAGGSTEPNDDPENPGGPASNHHPPAE